VLSIRLWSINIESSFAVAQIQSLQCKPTSELGNGRTRYMHAYALDGFRSSRSRRGASVPETWKAVLLEGAYSVGDNAVSERNTDRNTFQIAENNRPMHQNERSAPARL
jgi:hypothetical protein